MIGQRLKLPFPHPTSGAIVDVEGHIAVVSNILAFGTAAERDVFIGWNGGVGAQFFPQDEPLPDSDLNDRLQWRVRARTYRKRNDFPTDEENAPLWDEETAIAVAEEHAESVIATPIPAYAVTATVNLETLEISMTKS
jgi:hypothetical protein